MSLKKYVNQFKLFQTFVVAGVFTTTGSFGAMVVVVVTDTSGVFWGNPWEKVTKKVKTIILFVVIFVGFVILIDSVCKLHIIP